MSSRAFRILHITDQHFCNSYLWAPERDLLDTEFTPELAESIARRHFDELRGALQGQQETRPPFDAVVLSGDFTHQNSKYGFEIAARWIRLLVEADFAPSHKILLIPGNHDVNLGSEIKNSKTRLPMPRLAAEKAYREFLKALPLTSGSPRDLSMAARVSRDGEATGLVLIGLNSCRTERSDARGWGYVGLDQLDSAMGRILDGEAGFVAREGDILIAFIHHNPLPIWDVGLPELSKTMDDRAISFLMDAPSLLSAFNAFGFSILMHGHAHLAKTARLEGYDPRPDRITRSLIVAGQGSFSVKDCDPHHFALLEIRPVDGAFRDRALNVSNFYAHAGNPRTWSGEGPDYWPLNDNGWRAAAVREARRLFAGPTVMAADQWNIRESWAPLYERPVKPEDRETSPEWRAIVERLAKEVGAMARKNVPVALVEELIDGIFEQKQNASDISGYYLPQFLAWKLRER